MLWFTIHRDKHNIDRCTDGVKIGDGHYFKSKNRFQTFYRDLDQNEIDCIFYSNGFREEKKYPIPHNIVKKYKKIGENPITSEILNAEIVRGRVKGDEVLENKQDVGVRKLKHEEVQNSQVNDPNPDSLREELFIKALKALPRGKGYDKEYENLIYAILLKLFIPPLERPKIEYYTDEGESRIDILMRNKAGEGFFNSVTQQNRIYAPYIIIECKNYFNNVDNPALAQIMERFGDDRGVLGFLVYRKSIKKDELFKQYVTRKNKKKSILSL